MAFGLLLCDDLLFASRIVGEGRAQGLTIAMASNDQIFLDRAKRERPSGVLLDLASVRGDLTELLQRLGEICSPLPHVMAFGSHVNVDSLRAARAAGCDPVLPRSKFVEELPRKLLEWIPDS